MSWWVWLIIIIVVLSIIGSFSQGEETNSTSSRKTYKPKKASNNQSPEEIAATVKTTAQFRALERKLETAESKLTGDSATSVNYDSLCEKYDLLQKAVDIASNRVLAWQFIPGFGINTPLNILNNAYKVFTPEKYEEKLLELGGNKDEWYKLRGYDEPDEKDSELSFSIKFRKIIENEELTIEDKSKKINSLVSRNKEDAEVYFDLRGKEKASEQWFGGNA